MKGALVAAIVAAVVAAAAATASTAVVITSKQIKDRTIQVRDLNPAVVKALKAKPLKPYIVDRDGDSRLVAAGSAAEFSAKCQAGETPVSATWTGGSARDLWVWGEGAGNSVAAVLVNDSGIDMRMQLNAVCLRLTTTT
jgi:hypothetical protein